MKKRMVRITGCLLAGALSIGSFGLNTYAAPVAGVSSVTAVEIAEGQTPAAGVSQALAQCLADSNDAAAQKAAEQGGVLQSYSNDGESGTFDLSQSTFTEEGKQKKTREIIYRYLGHTGLLYQGV